MTVVLLPERVVPALRLGRHQNHDPRNRNYPASTANVELRAVLHRRHVPIYDQGEIGRCEGEALAGTLSTGRNPRRYVTQRFPTMFYRGATSIDQIPGTYPPDDTGTDNTSVCQYALQRGKIRRYEHVFNGLTGLRQALQTRPLFVGTKWRTGQDTPDSNGLVRYTGDVRGGHAYSVIGDDPARHLIRFAQSWGTGWGDHGYFDMTYSDVDAALADGGEATVPIC